MPINVNQLKTRVVEPVLHGLGLHSDAATNLILGTAAQESRMGTFLVQLGGGPALGIFQMEPNTHDDIWLNFLQYREALAGEIRGQYMVNGGASELVWNLAYATAMCRMHYLRKPGAIPTSVEGMAAYWKKHYNTELGKGTEEEFIANYNRYVVGG